MKPNTAGIVQSIKLKSVTKLATYAALHSSYHIGEPIASFPSYVLLPCAYDICYDYAVLLLISLLLHALINATCAGTRLYRQTPDFRRWFDTTQVSYHCVHLIHATFQSNCAEGLHFSAFHSYMFLW